jgi:hypothetical protein
MITSRSCSSLFGVLELSIFLTRGGGTAADRLLVYIQYSTYVGYTIYIVTTLPLLSLLFDIITGEPKIARI